MTAEHDDDDEHVITLSSRALCCLPSMKKQKQDHFFSDNPYLDLDYSGYHENFIILAFNKSR